MADIVLGTNIVTTKNTIPQGAIDELDNQINELIKKRQKLHNHGGKRVHLPPQICTFQGGEGNDYTWMRMVTFFLEEEPRKGIPWGWIFFILLLLGGLTVKVKF